MANKETCHQIQASKKERKKGFGKDVEAASIQSKVKLN